jgi:hypothetical protein
MLPDYVDKDVGLRVGGPDRRVPDFGRKWTCGSGYSEVQLALPSAEANAPRPLWRRRSPPQSGVLDDERWRRHDPFDRSQRFSRIRHAEQVHFRDFSTTNVSEGDPGAAFIALDKCGI